MAKVKLRYDVKNNLDSFIIREVGKRMANSGMKIRKVDIINEVASYCGVGYENINRIKRNVSQPSLAVALKISSYFNVKVEDIFKIS
jgi:DNA-binding XRE family transcriptional regulator